MSTIVLYHGFGVYSYEYVNIKYRSGLIAYYDYFFSSGPKRAQTTRQKLFRNKPAASGISSSLNSKLWSFTRQTTL